MLNGTNPQLLWLLTSLGPFIKWLLNLNNSPATVVLCIYCSIPLCVSLWWPLVSPVVTVPLEVPAIPSMSLAGDQGESTTANSLLHMWFLSSLSPWSLNLVSDPCWFLGTQFPLTSPACCYILVTEFRTRKRLLICCSYFFHLYGSLWLLISSHFLKEHLFYNLL